MVVKSEEHTNANLIIITVSLVASIVNPFVLLLIQWEGKQKGR